MVNENDVIVQALNVGQFTTDIFNYTVQDPAGLTDWAVLTVTINGANDAPVGVNDSSASVGAVAATEQGGTLNGSGGVNATGNVLANDTDIDDDQLHAGGHGDPDRRGRRSGHARRHGGLGARRRPRHADAPGHRFYIYVVNENDVAVQALNVGDMHHRQLQLHGRRPWRPERYRAAHGHHQRRERCAGRRGRHDTGWRDREGRHRRTAPAATMPAATC